MSQFKEKAEIEWEFDQAYAEIKNERSLFGRFTYKKNWFVPLLAALTALGLWYLVRWDVSKSLAKDDVEAAFNALTLPLLLILISMVGQQLRRARQMRALYEYVNQLKADKQ